MMESPESFIKDLKTKSYKELLVIRDEMIKEIRHFEKQKGKYETDFCPSPDVVYQMKY